MDQLYNWIQNKKDIHLCLHFGWLRYLVYNLMSSLKKISRKIFCSYLIAFIHSIRMSFFDNKCCISIQTFWTRVTFVLFFLWWYPVFCFKLFEISFSLNSLQSFLLFLNILSARAISPNSHWSGTFWTALRNLLWKKAKLYIYQVL